MKRDFEQEAKDILEIVFAEDVRHDAIDFEDGSVQELQTEIACYLENLVHGGFLC